MKTSLLPSVAALAKTIHWPSGEKPTLWLIDRVGEVRDLGQSGSVGVDGEEVAVRGLLVRDGAEDDQFVEDQSGVPSAPADHGVS